MSERINNFEFESENPEPEFDENEVNVRKFLLEVLSRLENRQSSEVERGRESLDQSIYELTKSVTEFIHRQGYKQIILSDRSARPFQMGINTYWELAYPEEERPEIFFINPEGLRQPTSEIELTDKFEKEHPYLFANRSEPTFVFDVCVHSGETLKLIQDGLETAGFSGVDYGVAVDARNYKAPEDLKLDYIFSDDLEKRIATCYPFGGEEHLTKLDGLLHTNLADPEAKERTIFFAQQARIMTERLAMLNFPDDIEAQEKFFLARMKDLFPKELMTTLIRISRRESISAIDDRLDAKRVRDGLKEMISQKFHHEHPSTLETKNFS